MTKVRDPLSVHGVIKAALDEVGGVADAMAILPARPRGWFYDITDPDRPPEKAAKPSYEDVRALTRGGATAFVHDLAQLAGLEVAPRDGVSVTPLDAVMTNARMMADFGSAVGDIGQALAAGRIRPNDAHLINGDLGKLVADIQTLREQISALAATGAKAGAGD